MKKLLLAIGIATLLITAAPTPATSAGEPLFEQGCDVFDLVEDLGSYDTETGSAGRWLVRNLATGDESVYAWEGVALLVDTTVALPAVRFTTFVAWNFEGTGIQGTNRTTVSGSIVDELFNYETFYQGETFRGTVYKSGGISGTTSGNLITGAQSSDTARIILCKQGMG